MIFSSIDFAIFLPIVFLLYWFVFRNNLLYKNIILLTASYVFYAWWDYRFLSLIIFSSLVDFFIGQSIFKAKSYKKKYLLLFTSIVSNISLLFFFKYYNFFIDSFTSAFSIFGLSIEVRALSIILPIGISFYTFQTLSYTIDIYKQKIKPTQSLISFAVFVSFFPQLVAGPIERASHLLPQFSKTKKFNYEFAVDGLRQMLWGFFKKIVIADNCAIYVNIIFNASDNYNGSTLLIGAVLFAFQIYCDFSGYSDIAIGVSKLFGFNLKRNFAYPYFSRNIAEFWRRWHISLTTWFRDYIYIPLGGSKKGILTQICNILLVFTVSGLWHGANWTFVIWGILNAIFFIPLLIRNKNREFLSDIESTSFFPSLRQVQQIISTFLITTLAWVFFRAENLDHAIGYLKSIFSITLFYNPTFGTGLLELVPVTIYIIALLFMEWIGKKHNYGIKWIKQIPVTIRWSVYVLLAFLILDNMEGSTSQEFIYFDF